MAVPLRSIASPSNHGVSNSRWFLHPWLFFLIAAPWLIFWQMGLEEQGNQLDAAYSNKASSGVHREERFVYFLHHLNLYPLATTLEQVADTPEAASNILLQHGDTLLTEVNHTARYGEHLKTFLLLMDSQWKNSTQLPSYHFANGWAFRLALLLLLASFCWVGHPWMGLLLVLLLGSNPFQLYEVYGRENVHGWVITTAILMLALFLPLLRGRGAIWYPWLTVGVAGVFFGTVVHIRTEPLAMILAAATAVLLLPQATLMRRMALLSLLLLGFLLTSSSWHSYFSWKIRESFTAVQAAGGVPYAGPREYTHQFWHPMHIGVADFDQTYGTRWDDRWAARKLFPILKQRYHTDIPPWDGTTYHFMNAYHDEGKRYYKALLLIPGFYELSKEAFLASVANDPLWYGKILLKRGWALLSNLTPMAVEGGSWRWHLPLSGLILFPLVVVLWRRREIFWLKVTLFTLPTCLPAFALYSGRGMTFLAIYHLVAVAVVIHLVVQGLFVAKPGRRNPASGRQRLV